MTIESLKRTFKLSHKISVYVPGTCGVNTESDNSAAVADVATLLSSLFGGATSTACRGYWMSSAAGLVAENTTLVFAYAAESDLSAGLDDVVKKCYELKAELAQEAVALELDGEMYFI